MTAAPTVRYARNGDVRIAYETFGDIANGEPLLLVMGLDFQLSRTQNASTRSG